MKKILRIGKGVKARRARVQELCALSADAMTVDVKVEMIQSLIPIGLRYVQEVLEEEVRQLAGERYQRDGLPGHDRWGEQEGSVYLLDHKLPIMVPRVRDQRAGKEVRLRSYERLQAPRVGDGRVLRRILRGLSCRDYEGCSAEVPEAFGMSGLTVSRRYIRASGRQLKKFCERRLEEYDFLVLILDGKSFGSDEMVIAMGVTPRWRKIPLGFIQTGGESEGGLSGDAGGIGGTRIEVREGFIMCDRWVERVEESDLWGVWE